MTPDGPPKSMFPVSLGEPGEHHYKIAETAAIWLSTRAEGNGLLASSVRLDKHDTLVHQLEGTVTVALKSEVKSTQKNGNFPSGEVLASKEAVANTVAGGLQDHLKDAAVQLEVAKAIDSDQGHGWGMKGLVVPLPQTKKDYCHIDKCPKCRGQGNTNCNECHSTGLAPCQGCSGIGGITCPTCFGTGMFQKSDGSRQQCIKCNGSGKSLCLQCNGQKTMRCRICNGTAKIRCGDCNASGHWTYMHTVSYAAELSFNVQRESIAQDIQKIVDGIGLRALAADTHMEILRLAAETHEKTMMIPLLGYFPVARADFLIEGKPFQATVAGLHGKVVEMDPFLDPYVKPGISALLKLSKGGLAANALLETAGKYRLVKDALGETQRHSKKAAYAQLVKEYPVILSDKYARACVKGAADALLSLSKGPRLLGLAAGSAVAGAIAAGYFMGGLREKAGALLAAKHLERHIIIADMAVWLLGYAVAVIAIKMLAAKALAKAMPEDLLEKKATQPAGVEGLYALLSTFILWLAAALPLATRPEWLAAVLAKMGI